MSLLFYRNKRLLCIKSFYNTISANKKYIQNILFSISIHRSGLFNKIFEMNKIEQMKCHVLFKQVHTIVCICTLETNAYPANMKGSVQ